MNYKYKFLSDNVIRINIFIKNEPVGMLFLDKEQFDNMMQDIQFGRNVVHRIEEDDVPTSIPQS